MNSIISQMTQESIHLQLSRDLIKSGNIIRSREIITDAEAMLNNGTITYTAFAALKHLYENHEIYHSLRQ